MFASALWALDMLFESVRVGADGVNVHTHGYGLQSLSRATRGTDGRIRIVLINEDATHSLAVSLLVPGVATTGTVEQRGAAGPAPVVEGTA